MRIIDADELIKKWGNVHCKDISFEMAVIGAINDVKKAQTVDAVQVVRCRDCKYYPYREIYADDKMYLEMYERCTSFYGDGYCSMAERKEE